ncbi:C-type lectin [Plakobranchus ocellatus]|uniref:C-type lectin n=1 Tax=Plakobranchus ocellatus TaxID=259542 RepID=A0AAV4CUS3_9GAST|nr:C-type lectin [Plakobranchus ocellatus]
MFLFSLNFFIVILKLVTNHIQGSFSTPADAIGTNNIRFSLLSPDIVSTITYSVSTSGWSGMPNSVTCALRTITRCVRVRGFLYEPVSGQCTPVLWLHQGSGGTIVSAGSVDAHLASLFLRDNIDGFCQDGFKAWKYGSEGHFTCLLELTSLSSYQKATAECNSLGGYLASVRTVEELEMVKVLAKGTSMWIGLDDLEEEGVFKWQEDGKIMTDAEYDATFINAPNNMDNNQHCVEYGHKSLSFNDDFCDNLMKAICEIPSRPGVC